jgi:hypothetical protein
MTTFTVYRATDGDNAQSGLSLAEAAAQMLADDGRDWEIRAVEGGGFRIWNTYQNHARPWVSTRFFSAEETLEAAEVELFEDVISDRVNSLECVSDAEYEARIDVAAAYDIDA